MTPFGKSFAKSLVRAEAILGSDPAALIGQRIRELRVTHGLTQADVARATGMARPNVARLEHGVHDPSIAVVMRVAKAIGVKPSEIFAALDGAE